MTTVARGILPMLRQPLANGCGRRAGLVLRRGWCRRRAAAAGSANRRMLFSSHLPRNTGDVRSGYDVVASSAPSAEQSAALIVIRKRDATEAAAVDAGNAVMPRQPFVDERVVGVQEIHDAAILADRARRQTVRFPAGRPATGSGRSWDSDPDRRRLPRRGADSATARRNC